MITVYHKGELVNIWASLSMSILQTEATKPELMIGKIIMKPVLWYVSATEKNGVKQL